MAAIQLMNPDQATFSSINKLYHDGIELEKGVVLTPSFLERNENLIADYMQTWSAYPDIYLDLITPEDSNFTLFPYQRIFLRVHALY